MWNGRFFVLSRLISWTSYSMCDNADKHKKTNIVPNSNSLFLGFFQLKYMFWRQRIKVLSLALLTLRLSIFYNPRSINGPAKSKTDSWANVYPDGRTFSKQKKVFSLWMLKNLILPIQGYSIHLLACTNEVIIYLPWTFHSLPEIHFCWTHYSFQVSQSLGDWCYNLSLTAPF